MVFVLKGIVMAAVDDLEYYHNLSLSKFKQPPPFASAKRITKEDAEKSNAYSIVKRDEKGRVLYLIKVVNGKCSFHLEYKYGKESVLESIKDVNSDEGKDCFGRPIAEYLLQMEQVLKLGSIPTKPVDVVADAALTGVTGDPCTNVKK
jgi:hypothetical protein